MYSSAQTQLDKRVQMTRLTCKITRECFTRACATHVSDALPPRESKLASLYTNLLERVLASTRKQTLQYSRTNLQVLAKEITSTCNHSRQDR